MAEYDFYELKSTYGGFSEPYCNVKVNDASFDADKKSDVFVSDVRVENTSGFEASVASFCLYNTFDGASASFVIDSFKKYVYLGSVVSIFMGYRQGVTEVFKGVITRVRFFYDYGDLPGVEVFAMDVKAMMMSNNYSKQILKKTYSEAVREILAQSVYAPFADPEPEVGDTPDAEAAKGEGGAGGGQEKKATDKTIEMVGESDYEFVVRVARRFNFEFFTDGGRIIFRKAKSVKKVLMELTNQMTANGLYSYEVEYDITGLTEEITVRGMDVGKAQNITSDKVKFTNKLSLGNRAKPVIKGHKKVYIDPTVSSREDAGYRASYLAEEMAYRLGTLTATIDGIPELSPGLFVKLSGFGEGVNNYFYLTSVIHTMDSERGYLTRIVGKAASIDGSSETELKEG